MKQIRYIPFFAFLPLFFSCAAGGEVRPVVPAPVRNQAGAEAKRALIRTEPAQVPEWKDSPPQNDTEIYFVGVSRSYDTEADARNAAREDAFTQIVKYYRQYIQTSGIEKSSLAGSSDDILNPYIKREEDITRFAQSVISQVGADRYYTEVFLDSKNRETFVVYVLCQISKARAERDIDYFAKNISERYGNLIGMADNLLTALKVYADTYEALRANPLHRTVAWYNVPAGRVGLYEYCAARIKQLGVNSWE